MGWSFKLDMKYVVILALLLEMASLLFSPIKDYLVWKYSGVFQSDKVYVARTVFDDDLRYTLDGIYHPNEKAFNLTTVTFRSQVELARSIAYTVGFTYDPEAIWSVKTTNQSALKTPSVEYTEFIAGIQQRLNSHASRTLLLTMCSSSATSFNIGGGCWFQDDVPYNVAVEDVFMYLLNQMNPVPAGVVFGTKPNNAPTATVDVDPSSTQAFSLAFGGGFDGITLIQPRRLNGPVMAAMSTSIEANLCLRNYSLENLMLARIDLTWTDITTLRLLNYTKQDPLYLTKAMLPQFDMYYKCMKMPTFKERYTFLRDTGLREIYSRESFTQITNLLLNIAQFLPGVEDLIEPISYEGARLTVPSFKKEKNIFMSPAVVQMERGMISRGLDTSITPFLGTNDVGLGMPFWHGWYLAGFLGDKTLHAQNQYGFPIIRQIPRALGAYDYLEVTKFPDDSGVVPGTKHPLSGARTALSPSTYTYNDFHEFLARYWDVSAFTAQMKPMNDRYMSYPPGSMAKRPGLMPGYPEYDLADGAAYFLTTESYLRGLSNGTNLTEHNRKAFFFQGALSEHYTFDTAPDFVAFMQKLYLLFVNVAGNLPAPFATTQASYNQVNYVLTDLPCVFMSPSIATTSALTITFYGVDDGGFCGSLVAQHFHIRQDIYDVVAAAIKSVSITSTASELTTIRDNVIGIMERWEAESNTDLTKTPREMMLFDTAKTHYGYAKGDLRKLYNFVLSPNLVGRGSDALIPSDFRFLRREGDMIYRTEIAFGDKSVEGGVKFLTILSIISSLLNAVWTTCVLIFPNMFAVMKAKPTTLNKEEMRILRAIDLTSAAFFSPILLPFNFISSFIPAVRVVNAVNNRHFSAWEVFVITLTCWRLAVAVLFCVSRSHLPSRLVWMLSIVVSAVMIGLGEAGVGDEFENYSRAVVLAIVTFLICLGLFAPFSYVYTKKNVMQIREEGITGTLGIKVAHVDRATLYRSRSSIKLGHAIDETEDIIANNAQTVSIVTALELAAKHKTACLIDFNEVDFGKRAAEDANGTTTESRTGTANNIVLKGMFRKSAKDTKSRTESSQKVIHEVDAAEPEDIVPQVTEDVVQASQGTTNVAHSENPPTEAPALTASMETGGGVDL